jgi:drug/metabolite transporter (DMT)-like permease
MMLPQGKGRSTSYLLIAILALIWGSSFILMKRGLVVYSPYQIGAIRMFVSFLCLIPFVIRYFREVEPSKWKYLALSGILGNGIPSILFPLAETNISSAVAGMVNSLTPIFTLIIGMVFYKMSAGRNRLFGLALGLAGAIMLIFARGGTVEGSTHLSYVWYVVAATVGYAISVNILRNHLSGMSSVHNTGFALMFAGVPLGIYLFTTDFIQLSLHAPGAGFSLLCIVTLAVFGTALSTVLFNRLIKQTGALTASSVTYLIPIVATFWGLLDHESLGLFHLLGLGAILLGVNLINKKAG